VPRKAGETTAHDRNGVVIGVVREMVKMSLKERPPPEHYLSAFELIVHED
jgi:hypothetical protein